MDNEAKTKGRKVFQNGVYITTLYPAPKKGGTMKLNIELSDIEAKAVREFPKYDDIHVWEKQTAQGEQTLHKGFYSAIRKIVDAMRNKEGKWIN